MAWTTRIHQNMSRLSLTHTQYKQVEMYHCRPLQVEKSDLCWPWITAETLVYTLKGHSSQTYANSSSSENFGQKKMHYLHVCVFFVTEIPRREEIMTKVRKCPVCFLECTLFTVYLGRHFVRWWCRDEVSLNLTWQCHWTCPRVMQPWRMGRVSITYWF